MAKKDIKITFDSEKIMYVSVSGSKSGYNYASVNIKISDDNYMSIGYEWKQKDGSDVPDFVMDLLSFISKDKANIEKASEQFKDEAKEFVSRFTAFLADPE